MAITLDGSNVNTVGVVNTQTVKSATGATVDFTGIPSGVKRINLMFYGVSSGGASNWLVRLGTSGGFATSGYLGSGSYNGATNGGLNSTAGFILIIGSAAQVMHGSMIISLVDASTYKWVQQCTLGDSSQGYVFFSGGSVALSGILTQVRLTTVNGTDTFDAGSINVLYE